MKVRSTLFEYKFTGLKMHLYPFFINLVQFKLAEAIEYFRLVLTR